jgi:hypothetical protein
LTTFRTIDYPWAGQHAGDHPVRPRGRRTKQSQRTIVPDKSYRTSDGSDGTRAGTFSVINNVPMADWAAAEKITRRVAGDGQKVATDVTSVYRPLPLCRLMDTRNLGAPFGDPILTASQGRALCLLVPAEFPPAAWWHCQCRL